jgi:plasmid stabilization system protein ParE
MKRAIHRSQTARQDLVHAFRYYAREAGFRVAQRFFAQAEATFTRLASMPGMGAGYEHDHPALAGLRFAPSVKVGTPLFVTWHVAGPHAAGFARADV